MNAVTIFERKKTDIKLGDIKKMIFVSMVEVKWKTQKVFSVRWYAILNVHI